MIDRTPLPHQEAEKRAKNFEEVALGYNEEEALREASRCLNCKNPRCVAGCPVNVNIPLFILHLKNKQYEQAYETITSTNSLPAVCGRVCPQENQCEGVCVLGIKGKSVGIGNLERFTADTHEKAKQNKGQTEQKDVKPILNKDAVKIAVVGSGPAGLSCAGELVKLGYAPTVFEALHVGGGVLSYGIPQFRLPKSIVESEINSLKEKGVELITNRIIGCNESVEELFQEGFKAVFIGTGAGLPRFMDIEGEELKGVFSANEYLTRVNLMKAYREDYKTPIFIGKKTVVVGGGNVAMDGARCALRLGSETTIVYRRSFEELPARAEEAENAKEEGIIFNLLTNPVRILGDEKGWVKGIECVKMELGEPDASGRRSPVEIEGSNFVIDCDCVIMAIGTSPNPLIKNTTPDIEYSRKGTIIAQENGQTSKKGVYAGGDAVTGAATVISAMGAGRKAAKAIDEYLKSLK